jgi:energy-coupling factor transporter ATP-binding protein EcfA2/uncharacterized alkaline shock family protein YloU
MSDKVEEHIFNLPISYLISKQPLAEHIKTDLELIVKSAGVADVKGVAAADMKDTVVKETSLYDSVFLPTTRFGQQTVPLWAQYYTANKDFITDSQKLIRTFRSTEYVNFVNASQQDDVHAIWTEIEKETGFVEKYHYMDWKRFKEFNNNAFFLQLLSLYNMTSPLISLAIPIFFLIFPFILLKIQGIPITVSKYVEIMKLMFKQHQLGQIFTIGSASWDKMIYILVSFGFYIVQVYQNITSCIKYYHNMKKIHAQLFTVREYAVHTLQNMAHLQTVGAGLATYQPFLADLATHQVVLEQIVDEFGQIVPNGLTLKKAKQIGHVMKCFYQLYNKVEYHQTLRYSFGLNGYLDNLVGLVDRYAQRHINPCKLIKTGHVKFKAAYFPSLGGVKPVKNTYKLQQHLLITGPNAAGKTTLLKTTIFNVLLSQQTGFGFYKAAHLLPYDQIHCYINIPDTSARDSLFQAEARRCKEILTSIAAAGTAAQKEMHLCVFDELYSGTNPYEAIGSAYAFLSYLNKYPNVNFVLTTHFLDLCKRLETQPRIHNYHMEVQEHGEDFTYTYKMRKNISTIKGGVKVLRDLAYPPEIINTTIALIKELVV